MANNKDYQHSAPMDGSFAKYALPYEPDDPNWLERQQVTVKCSRCPRWAGHRTTFLEMQSVFKSHARSRHV